MVLTFEVATEGIARLEREDDLLVASSRLPAGSYTTLRTYGGNRLLRLSEHVRRLVESVAGSPPLDEARVAAVIAEALRTCGHAESRLRLTWAPPRLFLSVEPFTPLPEALYREGVACATVPLCRQNPHAKDTRFIAVAARAQGALPPAVHEGLMRDEAGSLLEGLSSNFFAVVDEALRTADERVLHGVTRSAVLELAKGLVPVRATPVRLDELDRVSECFLTSSSRGVLPVVRIEESPIGDGRPGPVTGELIRRLAELVAREAREV